MTAGLDTVLIALYVELTDRIIPSPGFTRSGPGKPPEVTDAELACLAVAQVLLRCDDERHWLRAAPKLTLICTCDGTVTGCGLVNPKLFGDRDAARQMLEHQPANRPAPGTALVTDKGLSGQDTEAFFAAPDLGLTLIRPARKRRKDPASLPQLAAPAG